MPRERNKPQPPPMTISHGGRVMGGSEHPEGAPCPICDSQNRLPFTWVDAALWIVASVFLFTAYPAAFALKRDLDYLERSGALTHMRAMGLINP
jgi:hypothetical protein